MILKILNVLNCLLNIFYIKKYLHIFQLKDYNLIRYLKYFKKYWIVFVNSFLILLFNFIPHYIFKLWGLLFLILLNILTNLNLIKSTKTPLIVTGKIKRLYFICSILIIFSLIIQKIYLFSSILLVFLPIFSNFLNFYDKLKNIHFIKLAQNKLKISKAKIIAITGSNGKTSVKNILCSMLLSQYKVQASPQSFNTPLGLSKFINNDFNTDCDFIILEYGARHKNDIKKLCKIFGADFGIVTTIAPQHLESFKTIENVFKAKNELPKFLKNKLCIFNLDNKFTNKMFKQKHGKKYSVSITHFADVFATQIKVENYVTKFKLHTRKFCANVETKLLGKHNVTNILLATCLALKLGITIENIILTIQNLQPIPHRLEYIKSNINILDDSYNCSIASAKESIKVLLSTKHKKMIVTPGIIEGGNNQYNLNFQLGKLCTKVNYVIIVGSINKKAILDGLKSPNSKCKIFTSKTLDEAKQHFIILSKNDCLLLLNDLPDDYK